MLVASSLAEARYFRGQAWKYSPAQMMRDAGFEPDPHQIELLDATDRNILALWPRQSGKSQTCATKALHGSYYDPGNTIILAGEKFEQATEVFAKAMAMHKILAEIGDVPTLESEKEGRARFANGSRIVSQPSTTESPRGFTAKRVIVDEAAFTGDDVLAKVSPMVSTTRGQIICPSTPNGARGWFYERWKEPEGWRRLTVSVDKLSRLDPEEVMRQRNVLGDFKFRQEYLLEFLDGACQFFPTDLIERARRDCGGPLW